MITPWYIGWKIAEMRISGAMNPLAITRIGHLTEIISGFDDYWDDV